MSQMNNFISNFKGSELLPTYQTYFTEYAANIKTPATEKLFRSVQLFDFYGR